MNHTLLISRTHFIYSSNKSIVSNLYSGNSANSRLSSELCDFEFALPAFFNKTEI